MTIEIYDCTLREGEQAAGARFSLEDRLELVKRLDEFGVDYLELGWPVVSEEILKSFRMANKTVRKARIVAFGSTSVSKSPSEDKNLDSIIKSGVEYACIFGKSNIEHIKKQLKLTPGENLERIRKSVEFLKERGVKVFYDAEHYFDGYGEDPEYALETIIVAARAGAERIILCDTNGGIIPDEAKRTVKKTRERLEESSVNSKLGVHFHDDCGLALANTLSCLPHIKMIQGTINGMGERVGNLNFSEFIPVYTNKLGNKLDIDLNKLKVLNEEAYRLSGVEMPESRAFVGNSAFAHKGGVHIDATNKGASYEHMNPEDVGNKRIILLNTLGGSAGIINVASQFGYLLDKKNLEVQKKVNSLFEELGELEKRGYRIGAMNAEQCLFVEKYFGDWKEFFEVERWRVETGKENGKEESEISIKFRINGNSVEERLRIDGGPVDAAYKTISRLLEKEYPKVKELKLVDFHVGIARSRREESSVRTVITFRDGEEFETAGVDSNIIQSAIEALTKGFRYYLNKVYKLNLQNTNEGEQEKKNV